MASHPILRIRNWQSFQHYNKRRPPWIKLHFRILSSKDWVSASDSERVLAIACMLIASQSDHDDGRFEADPDYFRRVAYLNREPDFKSLINREFLEYVDDASNRLQTLADASLSVSVSESESDSKDLLSGKEFEPDDFVQFWEAYPKKEQKKDTQRIWNRLVLADRLAAYGALVKWKESSRWKEGVIMNPTTYLNQRRWEDQIPTGGVNGGTKRAGTDTAEDHLARLQKNAAILGLDMHPKPS